MLDHDRPLSIGRMKGFHGNVGILVRAYAYIRALGQAGLRDVAETAVLNANYVLAGLRDVYDVPFDRTCKHEFVLSARTLKREHGVRALDVAKRLMDFGIHPPTMYFPLLVDEALMIEPTETESKETLDRFVAAMRRIAAGGRERRRSSCTRRRTSRRCGASTRSRPRRSRCCALAEAPGRRPREPARQAAAAPGCGRCGSAPCPATTLPRAMSMPRACERREALAEGGPADDRGDGRAEQRQERDPRRGQHRDAAEPERVGQRGR